MKIRRTFLTTSLLFCLGFVLITGVAEVGAAHFMASRQGLTLAGSEVYLAQSAARRGDDRVETIYLGDSVARQLFTTGNEPDPRLKFLATNQAVSVAGQYYLLREALATHHHVRQVSLFYNPQAWSNNLDQVFTHDYFCGYFHRFDQVREVFTVTHDWSLLAAHVGRALAPNLALANAYMSMSEARHAPASRPVSGHSLPIGVSPVSEHFLREMRRLAAARGIQLSVYPCPVSDEFSYRDERHVYDAPIVYLPREEFVEDGIHLKTPYVGGARNVLVARLSLDRPPSVFASHTAVAPE